jgi:Domain of unknown function (DUF4082)
MPEFGTLGSTEEFPSGGLILDGTIAPGDATGSVGDFYMDTTAKILYGPKGTGYGPDEYAVNPAIVPGSVGAADFTVGFRVQFLVPGIVTALRFYRATGSTVTSRTLTLYRAGVSVATTTSSGESGMGWKQVPLATPVTVDSGVTYITAYHTGGSYFGDYSATPPSYSPTHITNIGACYTTGMGFPSVNSTTTYWLADLVFKAEASPWPIAIKSAP